MRVALLAPVATSLYSRLVAHLITTEAKDQGLELVQIVVRTPWNLARVRSEFRRDGARLIEKVRTKLLIGEEREESPSSETLASLARDVRLDTGSLKRFAALHAIPYQSVPDHNHPAALHALRRSAPDVIAFTGGGMIRKELLSVPRLGVLNCHCGILPQYRGMDVVEWPAAEHRLDAPGLGLTCHFMDEGLDTGPVLLRRPVALRSGDTFASIRARIAAELVRLMMAGLGGLQDGTIAPEPQSLHDGRQYFVMHPRIMNFASNRLTDYLRERHIP